MVTQAIGKLMIQENLIIFKETEANNKLSSNLEQTTCWFTTGISKLHNG